ncbi:MAG: hypothetical protein IJS31_02655 [Oscillospiraceae bacterium]|nr:hypothetical protein [Oscillospiraceae bacterium]
MNEILKFRTSFGGFHRGDVAEYIERTAQKHNEALKQLRQALDAAEEKAAEAEKERDSIKAILQRLEDAYEEAKATLTEE